MLQAQVPYTKAFYFTILFSWSTRIAFIFIEQFLIENFKNIHRNIQRCDIMWMIHFNLIFILNLNEFPNPRTFNWNLF